MTLRIEETQESRMLSAGYEPNQNSIEVEFVVWDTGYADLDPVNVEAFVAATLQAAPYGDPLYGLRLQTINCRPITKSIFTAVGHYGVFEPPAKTEAGSSVPYRVRVGFSISGGSEHINTGLNVIQHALPGLVPTDHNFGINVTKDGPQGTTINIGQLSFRVTAYFDPAVWTPTQWLSLNDLANTWNVAPWRGWPAETLLFSHAECGDYEEGTGQLIPVTFHFMARKFEAIDKGNGIPIFTKAPWWYAWDEVEKTKDAAANAIGTRIICVHETQLYAGSDFTLLGIGS